VSLVVHWAASAGAPLLRKALRQSGAEVIEADTAVDASRAQIGVAGLPSGGPDPVMLHSAQSLRLPTLWLATDAEQAAAWLPELPTADDIALVDEPTSVQHARLVRVAQRLQALGTARHLDPLTGIANRRWMGGALRRALEALLPGDALAVVLLDVDHFKRFNHRYGHATGDAVLAAIGQWLRQRFPDGTPTARMGGEEFAVLLKGTDPHEVVREAESAVADLGRSLLVPDSGEPVTVSAGLAFARPGLPQAQWLEQADLALYDAKALGRNRLVHHELIGAQRDDPEAELARFRELTRHTAERMTRMVDMLGHRLVDAANDRAQRDALTGLRNRGFFDQRLAQELRRAERHRSPLALVLLDLDHFHDINARFNYTSGDAVLRQFAALAADRLRAGDWLARYGGEEFALVMPGATLDEAAAAAERLRAAVETTRFVADDGSTRVPLTVSLGVTCSEDGSEDALTLCQRAGAATLQAKEQGRNRVVVAR